VAFIAVESCRVHEVIRERFDFAGGRVSLVRRERGVNAPLVRPAKWKRSQWTSSLILIVADTLLGGRKSLRLSFRE
jgi:hypothetical protein